MKPVSLITIPVFLALGAALGWYAAHSQQLQPASQATTVATRKVLYWYDPMKPDQHFDKAGKSPFMDMQLVARYADEAGSPATIQIDGQVTQNLAIRLAKVEKQALDSPLSAAGSLVFNERDVAILQARANSFVERIYPHAPGEIITAGAPLADVLIPEWAGAQQEFIALLRTGDPALIEAGRNRLRLTGMPASLIREVEKTAQVKNIQTLHAPISGVIQSLDVRAGMTLSAGMSLVKINGIQTLWLDTAVPEAQARHLRPGQTLEAHLANGDTLQGKVLAILPELNSESRTLKVRAEIPNPKGLLRPGMWASVNFRTGTEEAKLTIPSEALIRTGTRNVVMVAEAGGQYRPQEVSIGEESQGKTVIVAGLSEGQQVVASGQFLLDSEANLKGLQTNPLPPTNNGIEAHGKIESIKDLEVTISHEAIPRIKWPAMTMPFTLANAQLAQGLKAGEQVKFILQEKDGNYVIEKIERSRP